MKRSSVRIIATLPWLIVLAGSLSSAQNAQQGRPLNVGIVIGQKPYITELAGPLDVYHHVPADKMKVFVVAESTNEALTYEGLPFRANYNLDNAPPIDVLVVPSGAGSLDADLKNKRLVDFVRRSAKTAKLVTSHCEGAFLLAEAGLLDNRDATTFPTDQDALQKRYPMCRVRKGQRVVTDGNLVTSAGGLASYEGALMVVERLLGAKLATTVGTALVFGPSNFAAARPAGK